MQVVMWGSGSFNAKLQNETTTTTASPKRARFLVEIFIYYKVKRNVVVGPINQWDQAYIV